MHTHPVQSLATRDFIKDKSLCRSLSFQYEDYFRECTRFYSKFDSDFGTETLRPSDTKLVKRMFKLYKGFQKKTLEPFSDVQANRYFQGNYSPFIS